MEVFNKSMMINHSMLHLQLLWKYFLKRSIVQSSPKYNSLRWFYYMLGIIDVSLPIILKLYSKYDRNSYILMWRSSFQPLNQVSGIKIPGESVSWVDEKSRSNMKVVFSSSLSDKEVKVTMAKGQVPKSIVIF